MKQGDNYTLTVGDQSSTFTLDDITYSEGSGGMQRPGGNLDNGQNDSTNGSSQNTDNRFELRQHEHIEDNSRHFNIQKQLINLQKCLIL